MTDRFHTLTVVLERDIREDNAMPLINAIERLRGVLRVTATVADIESHMAEERARRRLGEALWHVLYPEQKP